VKKTNANQSLWSDPLFGLTIETSSPTTSSEHPHPLKPSKAQAASTPLPKTKLAVSAEEAAEIISVSRSTFDRLVKRGLIHPVKATRKPVFAITELQRFLDETAQSIDP